MTSLFKRSSSNGGSRSSGNGGGGGSGQGQLNNSRPSRQVRRLEFNQAMEDFKTMFPSMDYEVSVCCDLTMELWMLPSTSCCK